MTCTYAYISERTHDFAGACIFQRRNHRDHGHRMPDSPANAECIILRKLRSCRRDEHAAFSALADIRESAQHSHAMNSIRSFIAIFVIAYSVSQVQVQGELFTSDYDQISDYEPSSGQVSMDAGTESGQEGNCKADHGCECANTCYYACLCTAAEQSVYLACHDRCSRTTLLTSCLTRL